jgi:hypothetical protein
VGLRQTGAAHAFRRFFFKYEKAVGVASTNKPVHPSCLSSQRVLLKASPVAAPDSMNIPFVCGVYQKKKNQTCAPYQKPMESLLFGSIH